MSEHRHEPIIGLDNILRCRTCGKELSSAEEIIVKTQSALSARRVQDEIAIAGRYFASHFQSGSLVYSKSENGLRFELSVRLVKDKECLVIRNTIKEGNE